MTAGKMLKIGDLKKQTGVSVGTIRYYEQLELLPAALRHDNGYRYFPESAIQRVLFIKKAQILNLSLTEIKEILSSHDRGRAVCSIVKDLLEQKISQLETEIQQLIESKKILENHRDRWSSYPVDIPGNASVCTLIEELTSLDTSNIDRANKSIIT
jgi:DNA-binding transcriptional MerR regulator